MECRGNMESVAKKFFALSEEEKGKVKRDINNPLGYYDAEHTKNVRDWKQLFDLAVENPAVFPASHELDDQEIVEYFNHLPENLPEFREDDVGGLEVERKTDGAWIRVQPIPDPFIVNLGDVMQAWTNEKYQCVEHRVVVNSDKERLSIGFFFNPAHHVNVEPLSEFIDHLNPPKYRPYNYGKFFAARKVSNFKKLDVENIQLTHF
ncbi:unnamed protein product [Camellia sinensis]